MQNFKDYLTTPSSWSEAVQRLWSIKRKTMFLTASAAVLTVFMIAIFWFTAAILLNEIDNIATPVFIFLGALYFIAFLACLITYLLEWLFYINLKKWEDVAPEQLKGGIKRYALFAFVMLIATAVVYFLDKFTHTPYISIIANAILLPAILAVIGAEIGKFVTVIKMRKAEEMPQEAKSGFTLLYYSFIAKYGSYILGAICLFISLIAAMVDDDVDFEEFGTYGNMFAYNEWVANDMIGYYELEKITPYYGYEWYADNIGELFKHDLNDIDYLLDGLMRCIRYDCEEAIDELTDSDVFSFFSITGLVIIALGAILSFVLHYRGWWLIAQSDIEPTAKPVTEDTPYEDVTEAEVIEAETKAEE